MRTTRFILMALVLALAAGACARSDFGLASEVAHVRTALEEAGLEVCETGELSWDVTPGFDHGSFFRLGTDCESHDPNRPGATVSVAAFDSQEARDAAQLRFLTHYRRHPGTGAARTLGPLLITIDGSQETAAVERFRDALEALDAQ